MAVVLALSSAVVYGAADFLGGLASRRTSVFGVVAMSQVVGLVALVAHRSRDWVPRSWPSS